MAGTPDDPAHTSRSRSFDTTHYVVVLLRETAVCCRAELPHEIVDEPLELVNRPLSRRDRAHASRLLQQRLRAVERRPEIRSPLPTIAAHRIVLLPPRPLRETARDLEGVRLRGAFLTPRTVRE